MDEPLATFAKQFLLPTREPFVRYDDSVSVFLDKIRAEFNNLLQKLPSDAKTIEVYIKVKK